MDFELLLKGFLLGLSIAAPVGPIGLLCIRRTMTDGKAAGFVSGLGAASADAFYGSLAAFGLAWITDLFVSQQLWLRLAGGGFLCYLGLRILTTSPSRNTAKTKTESSSLLGAYFSTLMLTLSNPMTIFSFLGIFAGLGASAQQNNYTGAAALVGGVFSGSATWWLLLSLGAGLVSQHLSERIFRMINLLSGTVIAAFGLWMIYGLFQTPL